MEAMLVILHLIKFVTRGPLVTIVLCHQRASGYYIDLLEHGMWVIGWVYYKKMSQTNDCIVCTAKEENHNHFIV